MRLLYWLVVTPAGLMCRALGRDPLLLRRSQRTSYWIALTAATAPSDYLSPADKRNRPRGVAGWLAGCLRMLARRPDSAGLQLDEARPLDIPDEIYTLW